MTKTRGLCVVGCVLVAGTALAGDFTSQGMIPMTAVDGQVQWGYRCGTQTPDAATLERVEAAIAGPRWQYRRGGGVTVPVVFHVIYTTDDEGNEVGRVPREQLEAQIDVLNASYADFRFVLDDVEEVYSPEWFDRCYQRHVDMKRALAVSPETTLNVYTCVPQYGQYLLLGFAMFPWSYPEDDYRHGVVLHYGSLPGQTVFAGAYDEGDTATHEIGHYLGLLHTFQGGCTPPGDSVDDTPYEASAAFFCPLDRDTCPDDPGPDPIHNFMDYTDDWCMDHFTPLQDERMQAIVEEYRPTLVSSRGN
jgi:hypothetical protein